MVLPTACGDISSSVPTSASEILTNEDLTGRMLPDVSLLTTAGEPVAMTSLLGRPLLINFWYSTCEPCRREMPALANAHTQFGDHVDFVGVNMSDPGRVAQNFADRYGVRFSILLDRASVLTRELGVAIAPTTLFVGADGIIVEQVSGELTEDAISMRLTKLIAS
jgi:thiol-disulfide isomerase/thioredoxin